MANILTNFQMSVIFETYQKKGGDTLREQGGEQYLTLAEIEKRFGWKPGTVYYFREKGLLELYQFTGDKRSYCKLLELESIRDRPPEVKKRGPKDRALATTKTDRARGRTVVVTGMATTAL